MFFPAQGRRAGIGRGLSIPVKFDGEVVGASNICSGTARSRHT
jgi:hypothetical protein